MWIKWLCDLREVDMVVSNVPLVGKYTLYFNNQITPYLATHTDFYTCWLDLMFEYFVDAILTNAYILVIDNIKTNKDAYIANFVDEAYNESLFSIYHDITEVGSQEDNRDLEILHAYLYDNEAFVKDKMMFIIHHLIFDIFNNLYSFVLQANSNDVYFSNYNITPSKDVTTFIITCTPTMEVIKRYDASWYDRLCMFAPI